METAGSRYSEKWLEMAREFKIPDICIPLSVQELVVHVHQGRQPDRGSNDSPKHLLQLEPTGDTATHIHPHAHTRHVHRGGAGGS